MGVTLGSSFTSGHRRTKVFDKDCHPFGQYMFKSNKELDP